MKTEDYLEKKLRLLKILVIAAVFSSFCWAATAVCHLIEVLP